MFEVFEKNESEVRSYCRKFPAVFSEAKNALLIDTDGKEYIDFFAGAGAINFGHNNPYIKRPWYNFQGLFIFLYFYILKFSNR